MLQIKGGKKNTGKTVIPYRALHVDETVNAEQKVTSTFLQTTLKQKVCTCVTILTY